MNKNIEVINPYLWGVNYHHLKFIKELTYQDNSPGALEKPASLTNDGIIVLNKSHEMYPTLKQFFPKIMESTDEELLYKIKYMKDKDRDGYDRVYKYCLDAEAKRRFLEKEFQKQNKGKPLIRKILNFLRLNNKKGVKSWHQ
jgi:hypothetical protein